MRNTISFVKLKLYIDTSVIGGCLDEEFAEQSTVLIRGIRRGLHFAMISDLTRAELLTAPASVRMILDSIPARNIIPVALSPEAAALAEEYIRGGVLTPGKKIDAQHIALATVAGADVLVSWNFKHIVNVTRIRGYNAVNAARGYRPLDIREPREVH